MKHRGFTLIELIVVMTMLTVIMAISVPRLSTFFRGQSINEEIKRFLALIDYARNEAVSTSTPIDLYINTNTGQYGITATAGYTLDEMKRIEFQIEDSLSFELYQQERIKFRDEVAHIVFLPDGYLDDISIKALRIVEESNPDQSLVLAQTNVGMGYELLQNGDRVVQKLFDSLNAQGINR